MQLTYQLFISPPPLGWLAPCNAQVRPRAHCCSLLCPQHSSSSRITKNLRPPARRRTQGFVEVYHGPDRMFKVFKLVPGARYSFYVLVRAGRDGAAADASLAPSQRPFTRTASWPVCLSLTHALRLPG